MINRKNTVKRYQAPGQSLKATARMLVERLAPSGHVAGRDAENWLIGKRMARMPRLVGEKRTRWTRAAAKVMG